MFRITTHFFGIDSSDKYSRIAAKVLRRKYSDPYPLTHACLQLHKLFIAYGGKSFQVTKKMPKSDSLKFSYTIEAPAETLIKLVNKYKKLSSGYPYNFSMASYFKPDVPWCTDFIQRLLFNYQGKYLQQPPYELLDELICSDMGCLNNEQNQ